MEQIFAVETADELLAYQRFAQVVQPRLEAYLAFLKETYAVKELPRVIVWTSGRTATERISDLPVPAYTNDFRIVMSPEMEAWQAIYQKQLLPYGREANALRDYYRRVPTQNHLLQILGHELAHHSDLFPDGLYDSGAGIWFEEGMVEYISRRFFLTDVEFAEEAAANRQLVSLYHQRFGKPSPEECFLPRRERDYTAIFYGYWRSFLAIQALVEAHGGDVMAVFRSLDTWQASGGGKTLAQWFGAEI